ncbi:MAG: NAD-dependent epimerase/dehydratase family protein [Pseudomonadota bacterium]
MTDPLALLDRFDLPPVAVLGASGRLGSMLRACWPPGPVLWLTRRPLRAREGQLIAKYDPLGDPGHLSNVLDGSGAQAVLSLAGAVSNEAEDLAAHAALAEVLLDATDLPVLLSSSAAVYGAPSDDAPLRDDAPLPTGGAMSDYGEAKRALEACAAGHSHATVLRIGNVAGFDAALGGWRAGFQLDRFADGSGPRRSYVGPGQLALILAALLGRAVEGPDAMPPALNVAAPGTVDMGALLDAAGRPYTNVPAPPTAIPKVELDVSTLQGLLPRDVADALAPATAAGLVADWRAVTQF